jgi:hypothetical protein
MIPEVSISSDTVEENIENEDTESENDFTNKVESAKNTLLADNDAEISGTSPMYE